MKNYYYLAASLPYIAYGDEPPFDSEEFAAYAKDMLDAEDAALLSFCRYDASCLALETAVTSGNAFVQQVLDYEKAFLRNLAYLRAVKLGRQTDNAPPADSHRAFETASAALDMESPLDAEIFINEARWSLIDELLGLEIFSTNNILGYALKLRLLERHKKFDIMRGEAAYKERYDGILSEYNDRSNKEYT